MSDSREMLLEDAFSAYSNWLEHGHASRAQAWLRRLEINRPELDLFRSLPACAEAPYLALAAAVLPAQGQGNSRQAGIPELPADAAHALGKARACNPGWHLFTALAAQPPAAKEGYLSGVPIAVKDMIAVQGLPLTGGSASGDTTPAREDAESVRRLKAHGAVVIGMANQHELAFGASSDNPVYGRVVNPSSPGHIPGGSSGGSAAIIAAGITRATLGTDTGGSVRLPAACCGVVGFKPSYDSVSRRGAIDVAPTLDHIGPLGKYVGDCARLFSALLDLPREPDWMADSLRGIRIGRLRGYFEHPLHDEVRAALDSACHALAEDRAQLISQDLPEAAMASALQFLTITAEAADSYSSRLRNTPEKLGDDIRTRLEIGRFLPAPWYLKAQRLRTVLAQRIDALFDQADILICPTLRSPAPAVGATDVDISGTRYPLHTAVTQLTMPFSLSGSPAISVPWGSASDGAPIGLQLIARRGDDWRLLGVAQRLEMAAASRSRPPDKH